jgi:DNA-binding NarL/FixJ family response regulator
MTAIIIAEGHTVMRQIIRALLEKVEEITIVGEADNGVAAVALAKRYPADILITEVLISRMNGLEISQQLAQLNLPTRVMMLSIYTDTTLVKLALEAGAKAYLSKLSLLEELLPAIEAVNRGEVYRNSVFLSVNKNGDAEKSPGN